jgi:Fe-S cluster assembly protein SufD
MTPIIEKATPASRLSSVLADQQNQLAGSEFIRFLRHKALESFNLQGLPARKSEEYKYSPVTRLFPNNLSVFSGDPAAAICKEEKKAAVITGLEAHILRIHNGVVESPASVIEAGMCSAWNLASIPPAEKAVFEKHFGHYAKPDTDPFIALNTASFPDVLFIRIADQATLKKAILIQNITNSQALTSPRILILVGKQATVEIIEQFITAGKEIACFSNAVSEIVVAPGAKALYYKLQNDCPQLQLISTTQVYQGAGSHFDTHTVTFGGSWIRNNLNIVPDGTQCETHLNGLYILNGEQHVDNHTLVDHQQPHCESNQLYRGILNDKATGVFNGKIFVRPDAQKTNAYQSSKNMLLSDDASMYTKPQLEIYADDVKCSHGSSTGQIDEEALFYLRARGIGDRSARILLMQAFAKDAINTMRMESLRIHVEHLIEQRLHN